MWTPPTMPYYAPASDLPASLPTWEEIYAQTETETYDGKWADGSERLHWYSTGEWLEKAESTWHQVGEHFQVRFGREPTMDESEEWRRYYPHPRPSRQDPFAGGTNMLFVQQAMPNVRVPRVYAMYKQMVKVRSKTFDLNFVVSEFIPGERATDYFSRAAAFAAIPFGGPTVAKLMKDKPLIRQRVFLGELEPAEGRAQMRELDARLVEAKAVHRRRDQEHARRMQLYRDLTEPQLRAFRSLDPAKAVRTTATTAAAGAWPPCIKTYTRNGVVYPILTVEDWIQCCAPWSTDSDTYERTKQHLREELKDETMALIHPAGAQRYGLPVREDEVLCRDGSVVTHKWSDLTWGLASFDKDISDPEQAARTARVLRDASGWARNPEFQLNFDFSVYRNAEWSRGMIFPDARV